MRIFLEDNWSKWEYRDFYSLSQLLPSPDPQKDRWLLTYLAVYGRTNIQKYAMRRLGITEIPVLPVNPDDEDDDQYAPYLVLREQVMRESDYWVLKNAAFHAPKPMSRFAFCRLTGCSWEPADHYAYRYRTYSCGLKRDVSREDIEDLCHEMIEKKGPFQHHAAGWLKQLADISDEELAGMASERTERSWDREPDEILRKLMQPRDDCPEEDDLKDKICAVFDAYVMWEYSERFPMGAGSLQMDAMEDPVSDRLCRRFRYEQKPAGDVLTTIAELFLAGGRSVSGMTPEKIKETAWNVREHSPQHSFFLYLAYWSGIETERAPELALQMLSDAAQRGHLRSFDSLVRIYAEGKYVHRNFRLALSWQEKKVERCRQLFEQEGTDKGRREYRESLRQLGDLLMKEGFAKRAKQYYRKADQLAD